MNADLTINAGSATITQNGTVNGNNDLVLNTTGLTYLNNVIGGTTPLATLTITTGGPFAVAHNIAVNDVIQVTVLDTVGSDDDLTVQGGATVQSNNSTITFDVGDDVDIQAGTNLTASQMVTINADPISGDPDIFGATITIAGSVSGSTVELNGGDDVDIFDIQRTAAPTTLNAGLSADTINISSDAPTNGGTLDQIAGTLTVNGNAGADILNISDFGDTTGDATGNLTSTQLTGLGGAAISYATVETLNIDLGNGDDTFTIASTSSITTTTLNGNGGADTINIQTTSAGAVTTINGNGGDDIFNVGNIANSLDEILGLLTVNGNAPSASDTLNINDQGDPDNNTYTLTPTTLDRSGMAQLTYSTIEHLNLNTGIGNDTILVSDTHSGSTTVNANSGTDNITLQISSGTTTINAQADDDQIIVQTTGAGQTTTVNGDAGQDTFYVQATGIAAVTTLNGGADADTFNIQTIAGSTTVNAGSGADTVNVSSDAPANIGTVNDISSDLTINGDAGADTLNISDAGDPNDNTGDLTSTQLTGLGMSSTLTYGSLETLNIQLGSGNDNFSIHSSHAPSISNVAAGPGDDTYLIYDHWGVVNIIENAGNGIDTLDFTPVTSNLFFMVGSLYVRDGVNMLTHLSDDVEHLIGGSGDDWFDMAGSGTVLAGGQGTITGGLGYDTISYEHYKLINGAHRLYNGLGLATPADVENVVMPPENPDPEATDELFAFYGATTLDELIEIVKNDPGTYPSSAGSTLPLRVGMPSAVQTASGSLVIFSGGIGGTVNIKDLPESDLEGMGIITGSTYITQGGQMVTFGSEMACISLISVAASAANGDLGSLPAGEVMILVFQAPAEALGQELAIMWWDEARGMWREVSTMTTADGSCIAITNLTGTFALMAKE